ncbi:protein translocase SEC61 complex subunit gamma [Candidatus Woesearchaeota archaeon]|nr:protein translocase SEC61 complex subunit gamma [Candidatus Woesearchaeota archaeon]
MDVASWPGRIKTYLLECRRVLKITKKPTNDEFKTIVKVSGLGILLVGFIGFIMVMVKELLL